MNKVILTGRLTKDPEVRKTQSGLSVCSFVVASDRRFKNNNGEKQTDFIACAAWRQTADVVGNYLHKGSRIMVAGSLQTRRYEDNNGNTVNVTEVLVDEVEFLDPKKQEQTQQTEEILPIPPMMDVAPTEEEVTLPFDIM